MIGKPADASSWFCFLALLAVLAALEWLCAIVAYETLGEVTSAMLMVAVLTNLLPVLLFALRVRAAAVFAALVIALAIVPYQVVLANRLRELEQESSEIVSWIDLQRLKTGRFPANLASYHFHRPWLKEHFTDDLVDHPDGQGFNLRFYVGNRGTSHSFGATADKAGGWGYYAD
jgi:hypothetical protein